jgi:hypothetical protein
MRRVRIIAALSNFGAPVAAVALLSLTLLGIGNQVFVAQVFANMPPLVDMPAVVRFVTVAFLHTDLFVQVLSVVACGAVVWLAQETARSLESPLRLA